MISFKLKKPKPQDSSLPETKPLSLIFFFSAPVACGSHWTKDSTFTTAATQIALGQCKGQCWILNPQHH